MNQVIRTTNFHSAGTVRMDTRLQLFLHEEVMLLALRDREGKPPLGSMYQYAVAGALLAELLITNHIKLVEKKNYVQLIDAAPFGDTLLDESLEMVRVSRRRRKARGWVTRLASIRGLKHKAVQGLCDRGILRCHEKTLLLFFKQKVYPEVNHEPERELIERMRDAIAGEPSRIAPRTLVLLALAHATDLLEMVFDGKDLKSNKQRIEQITEEMEIGRAVKEVVEAAKAAAVAAATSAAVG